MRISYIRALCHTLQGKQRTGLFLTKLLYTLTEVVPASEPACQSRDWALFKLTQPIVDCWRLSWSQPPKRFRGQSL